SGGSTVLATSTSARGGPTISSRTRTRSRVVTPSRRPGMWYQPTGSGTGTGPCRACCSRRSPSSTRGTRYPTSTWPPKSAACGRPDTSAGRGADARSSTRERGLALLHERRHALGLVVGGEQRREQLALPGERRRQVHLQPAVDRHLGRAQRLRGTVDVRAH